MYKIVNLYFGCCLFLTSLTSSAADVDFFPSAIYFGFSGGYGSTTWQGLVPSDKNQNSAMTISTPTRVCEGGGMWGFFSGYQFTPYFALESHYRHYSTAHINFDKDSLFAFDHQDTTHFDSHTETLGLLGKIMLVIPNTNIQVYSAAGIADLHRYDIINNDWRLAPTFDLGFNFSLSRHWVAGIAGNYTAGYGESELDPAQDYFPFLYSVFVNITYRF